MLEFGWLFENTAVLVTAVFVLGLLIGSFLNVVILRTPPRLEFAWKREAREILELPESDEAQPPGLVADRSRCPKCGHQLSWYENIPVFSYLVLRGRCRSCKSPISIQYLLVELLTGAASAAVIAHFGPGWEGGIALLLTWILVAASGIDFRTTLLPDQFTLPALWLGLLAAATASLYVSPVQAIWGAALGYLSLWSVYWLFKLVTGKEGMGFGDFKLLAALGAFVGPQGLIPIVLMSSLVGAVIGTAILIAKGRDRQTPIPFGPFLAIAGWLQFLYGDWIIATYKHAMGFY
ncbi:MAG: prepilin peptidase [Rhodanobacteraceae bacterium]|nr:prepilin peptidase [Rhodanobacteraceae bacterium]MBL0042610.1 prepilin peptidase [Xanthomonadales bacterium]MBP6078732.1 prepilin peptidase [Xanthomonadales bacterium]